MEEAGPGGPAGSSCPQSRCPHGHTAPHSTSVPGSTGRPELQPGGTQASLRDWAQQAEGAPAAPRPRAPQPPDHPSRSHQPTFAESRARPRLQPQPVLSFSPRWLSKCRGKGGYKGRGHEEGGSRGAPTAQATVGTGAPAGGPHPPGCTPPNEDLQGKQFPHPFLASSLQGQALSWLGGRPGGAHTPGGAQPRRTQWVRNADPACRLPGLAWESCHPAGSRPP